MATRTFNAFQELFDARSGKPFAAARTISNLFDRMDQTLNTFARNDPRTERDARIAQQRLERLDKNMAKTAVLAEKERVERLFAARQAKIEAVDNRRTFYRKLDNIYKVLHGSTQSSNSGFGSRWWQLLAGAGLLGWSKLRQGIEVLKSLFGTGGMLARLADKIPGISRFAAISSRLFGKLGKAGETIARFAKTIPGVGAILGIARKIFLPITILMGLKDAFQGWYDTEGIIAAGGDPSSITDRVLSAAAAVFTGLFKPLSNFVNWASEKVLGVDLIPEWGKEDILRGLYAIKNKVIEWGSQLYAWAGEVKDWFGQQLESLRDWWITFKEKLTNFGSSWWDGVTNFFSSINPFSTSSAQAAEMSSTGKVSNVSISMSPLASEKFGTQVGRSLRDVIEDLTNYLSPTGYRTQSSQQTALFSAYQDNLRSRVYSRPSTEVANAIGMGAQTASGVSSDYLTAIAGRESGFNPMAQNPNSSAGGLFQFTDGTWKGMVQKYGASTNIGVFDKFNPKANAVMGALFTQDNADILRRNGIEPNNTNLYLAHFLGPDGAVQFLKARQSMPNQMAQNFFSSGVYNANSSLMSGKTLEQFYQATAADIDHRVNFVRNGGATQSTNQVVAAAPSPVTPPTTGGKVAKMSAAAPAQAGPTRVAAARAGSKPLLDDTAILHGDTGLILVNLPSMS